MIFAENQIKYNYKKLMFPLTPATNKTEHAVQSYAAG